MAEPDGEGLTIKARDPRGRAVEPDLQAHRDRLAIESDQANDRRARASDGEADHDPSASAGANGPVLHLDRIVKSDALDLNGQLAGALRRHARDDQAAPGVCHANRSVFQSDRDIGCAGVDQGEALADLVRREDLSSKPGHAA